MNRHMFERVLEGVQKRDDYFTTKTDAVRRQGIAGIVKVVAALKKLACGVSSDMLDDSLEMSATAISESMKRFCDAVIEVIDYQSFFKAYLIIILFLFVFVQEFGDEYLRAPTEDDIKAHVEMNAKRGFPGMFG